MPTGVYKRTESHIQKIKDASVGEKNPNWKGGIKVKDKKEYYLKYGKEYRKKRKKVRPIRSEEEKKTSKRLNRLTSNHKRRALLKNTHGSFTLKEWETLKAQYNWTCPCCKKSEPDTKLTIDHIIPISKGGSNNIENIQPLCKSCNCKKSAKIIKYDLLV